MLLAVLNLLCCAFVTALPPGEDAPEIWGEGKGPYWGRGNTVTGEYAGGGITIRDLGGSGGGGGCEAVACDIKVRYINGFIEEVTSTLTY